FALLYMIRNVGTAFVHLENASAIQTDFAQTRSRADGGDELESQARQPSRQNNCLTLVAFFHTDEGGARLGQLQSRRGHRLRVSFAESLSDAHHLASRMHL